MDKDHYGIYSYSVSTRFSGYPFQNVTHSDIKTYKITGNIPIEKWPTTVNKILLLLVD